MVAPPRQGRSLRRKRKTISPPHIKMGFTGTKKDSIGRTICFNDGGRVDCPRPAKEPNKTQKKGPEEQPQQPVQGKPQPQTPQQPKQPGKPPHPQLKPSALAQKKKQKAEQNAPPVETREQLEQDLIDIRDSLKDSTISQYTRDTLEREERDTATELQRLDAENKKATRTREQVRSEIRTAASEAEKVKLRQELTDLDNEQSRTLKAEHEKSKKFDIDAHKSLKMLKDLGRLDVLDEGSDRVNKSLEDLSLVPYHLMNKLVSRGIRKIYLGDRPITEMNDLKNRKGKPVGHEVEGINRTWDEVGGVYRPTERSAIAGKHAGGGSVSTALHELGHAIGDLLQFDNHTTLNIAHHELYDKLSPYFQQGGQGGEIGRAELFAETFAQVLINREDAISSTDEDFVDWIEKEVLGKTGGTSERAATTEW